MSASQSLRLAIRRSGLSLAELARRSGVSVAQLSYFVREERSLTLDSVDRLARSLGWPKQSAAPEYIIVHTSAERCIVAEQSDVNVDAGISIYEYCCISKRKRTYTQGLQELLDCYGVDQGDE